MTVSIEQKWLGMFLIPEDFPSGIVAFKCMVHVMLMYVVAAGALRGEPCGGASAGVRLNVGVSG